MSAAKMKKLRIIASREGMEGILRELIQLASVEVFEPLDLLEDNGLGSRLTREAIQITELGSNHDNLIMFGTSHTLILSGWIAARTVADLVSRLDNHLCAWELIDPEQEENADIPAIICCPGFFGKLRRRGRRQFSPLSKR